MMGQQSKIKRNEFGETALQAAAKNGQIQKLKSLLKLASLGRAQIEVPDHNKWRALHDAANVGCIGAVELLVEAGAKLDVPGGEDGMTPLMSAANCGHLPVVEFLIKKGASVKIKDKNGCTALDYLKCCKLNADDLSSDEESDLNEAIDKLTALLIKSDVSVEYKAPPDPEENVESPRNETRSSRRRSERQHRRRRRRASVSSSDEDQERSKGVAEYRNALRSVRQSALKRPGQVAALESPRKKKKKRCGAMTEQEADVQECWLEDDIGPQPPQRIPDVDKIFRDARLSLPPSTRTVIPTVIFSSDEESDGEQEEAVSEPVEPTADFAQVQSPSSISADPPAAAAAAHPRLFNGRKVRVCVDDGHKFIITLSEEILMEKTIGWLREETEQRYSVAEPGTEVKLALRTKDDCQLAKGDSLKMALEGEEQEISASIIDKRQQSLPSRYHSFCQALHSRPFRNVTRALESGVSSEKLGLKCMGLSGARVLPLLKALQTASPLRSLHLDGNYLGVDNWSELGGALCHLTSLSDLSLSGTQLTAPGLRHLVSSLNERPLQLTGLNLGCNPLGDESATAFADFVHKLPFLRRLLLHDVLAEDKFFANPVRTALQKLKELKELSVERNPLTRKGLAGLFSALLNLPQMRCLSMARAEESSNDLVGHVLNLASCSQSGLVSLDVSGHHLEAETSVLVEAVKGLSSLRQLRTAHTGLSSASASRVLCAGVDHPSLSSLDFVGCPIHWTNQLLAHLQNKMHSHSGLSDIKLSAESDSSCLNELFSKNNYKSNVHLLQGKSVSSVYTLYYFTKK